MALPPYLEQNRIRIINAPDQQITLWNQSYEAYRAYEVVNGIYKRFPDRNIQRAGVTELLREEPYMGFIAAMMWGGVNATRPATKGSNDTNFRLLLDYPAENAKTAILYVSEKIRLGHFQELFMAFEKGPHKIPGVGHAYFTKLFFFLGETMEGIEIKPIVYDKWLANAHCALLIQLFQDNVDYKLPYRGVNSSYPFSLKIPSGRKKAALYEQYLFVINLWAKELKIRPSKLEEFLFGKSLKIFNKPENPRLELWKIITNHMRKD